MCLSLCALCVGVCACASVCEGSLRVCVCVAMLCCRKARRVHFVWFDKHMALVISRFIGFEKQTTKAQGSIKGLHKATLKGTHRENPKVTIVETDRKSVV